MSSPQRRRPRIIGIGSTLLALSFGMLLIFSAANRGGGTDLHARNAFTPFFLPVYEIEAVSGSHVAHLLNLPLPNVGVVPQVPTPVDINGDLLPDVTVAVNLINAEGLFNNPPQIGQVIAPNIEINRLFTAPLLTPGGDPLKINIKFTVYDLSGGPNIVLRFGYDTGPGGSIPPEYKAIVGGIQNGFNPIQAAIDTTGGMLIGLDPKLPDLGLSPQSSAYEGPLTTFVNIDNGPALKASADLRFKPMPDLVNVTYGNDSAGQHFTYSHSSTGEVDLAAKANLQAGALQANVDARIDRLPRQVAVDFLSGPGTGGVSYQSSVSSGRLPDLSATADVIGATPRPIHARFDMEGLPQLLKGQWDLQPGQPPSVSFAGSGQGIGAVEAHIQNYTGSPSAFTPYVPKEQQHVSIQAGPGALLAGDTLISARIERIRSATVKGEADGSITGDVRIGDGERPLEVHGEVDLRPDGKPYIAATAKISPLPDTIKFGINPAGVDSSNNPTPTRIKYEPSETIDVDTDALVGLPGTTGVLHCGDAGTICGNLALRNIPQKIEARLLNAATENRVEVDAIQRAGAAPLDVFGSVIAGPVNSVGGPAANALAEPIRADISVQGLPQYLRMRSLKDPQQNLTRFEVRTCDVNYTTSVCAPGTDEQIREMTFNVRNFDARPANLPAPPESGPLYVTVVARGEDAPSQRVHFEAAGRMTSFKQLTYLGTGDMTGVRTDIGGNQGFRAFVDAKNIDVGGTTPADKRINVDADIRISRLPAPLTFCFAQNGRTLTPTPLDPITASCENNNPFGDGTVTKAPMTIAYDAGTPFDVTADIAVQGDFPFTQPTLPVHFGTFDRVAAHIGLTNIPGTFVGYIQTPGESSVSLGGKATNATRILTHAPGANLTKLDLSASLTTPGVSCLDPNPSGGAICANVLVDQLPEHASILAETDTQPGGTSSGGDAVVGTRVQAHACDWDFFGTDACRGAMGQIGQILVGVRAHAGSGAENPVYQPPATDPYAFAQATINNLSNFEVEAGLQVLQIRSLSIRQDPEGMKVDTDLGDGIKPLTVHAFADLRGTTDLVPAALRASILGEVVVNPLPQNLSISQTGPGKSQQNPVVITFDASAQSVVTAKAEVRELGSGPNCGDHGTLCAGFTIDKLPAHLDATIERSYSAITGNKRDSDTRIHVNQTRFNPTDKMDITAYAALGLPVGTPVVGEGPLFGDLTLKGIPNHISANMQSHEVLSSFGGLHVASSALERFQFQTCNRDYGTEQCIGGTGDPMNPAAPGDKIDLVQVSVRNFALRPTDFPTPPASHAPLYVGLAARNTNVEGFVTIPEISEVQFLNRDGVTGAFARVGGTTPSVANNLQVRVDVQGLPIADQINTGDQIVDSPKVDLKAAVDITPFPGELSFCMRQGGITPVPVPSAIAFTQVCENATPFGPSSPITHTPMSIGFHSNVTFDVGVTVDLALNGLKHNTATPIDQQRLTGALNLNDLPRDLTFHFLQPKITNVATTSGIVAVPKGPFHALVDTPGATSGIDLTFAAAYLVGPGATCDDPRPTVSATCLSGAIDDLPTKVEFFYDPDKKLSDPSVDLADPTQTNNFFIHADGPAPTRIHDLKISTVSPRREANGDLTSPPRSDVLLATATLDALPLPFDVLGTLDLPKEDGEQPTAIFEVQNGNKIPDLTVHVQNYISPDPTLGVTVPTRNAAANALATYQISAIMRGQAFRLDAHIPGVQKVGLRAVRGTNHKPLGTSVYTIGFGQDFNVRAYADLQPNPQVRAIADVLISDIPATTEVCMRGPREGAAIGVAPYPGTGSTFCDDPAKIHDNEGAIQVDMLPNTTGRKLDVDAFARLLFGGGTSLIAGRVRLDNLPQIIQVRLPGGAGTSTTEVNTFSRVGGVGSILPDGVDEVNFEAATADLAQADTPYAASTLPYAPRVNNTAPFPAQAAVPGEYVHAAANIPLRQFHVRGRIGGPAPSSQFERFLYSTDPCPTPPNNPADFPRAPVTASTKYSCIAAGFDAHTGGDDPLDLYAEAYLGDNMVAKLHNAGLNNIPGFVQVQMAQDETYTDPANKRGWRRPCGPAVGNINAPADPGGPCMAPMVRFDQPDPNTYVFGVLELAKIADLPTLSSVTAIRTAPNFDAVPSGSSWISNFFDQSGITAKVLVLQGGTPSTADDRIAAKVAFRLPIPQALTIDQPQSFQNDQQTKLSDGTPVDGKKASDFRFHMRMSRQDGTTVDHIGDLAAMLAVVDSGIQALITQPCGSSVTSGSNDGWPITRAFGLLGDGTPNYTPINCVEYNKGVEIPGEVGITMYGRDSITALPDDDGKPQIRSSSLIQVDGRISTNVNLGARLIAGGAEVAKGIRLGDVEAAIKNIPGQTNGNDPHNPSFRLRAEIVKDSEKPKEASSGTTEQHTDSPAVFSFTSTINIRVNKAFVGFDFKPTGVQARRIDATIYLKGTKVSADVYGFQSIDPADTTPADISAALLANIDPLDFNMRSVWNFAAAAESAVRSFITDTLGAPGWLADIIDWLISPVIDAIEAIMNALPIQIRLKSALDIQFKLVQVNHFRFQANLLHAKSSTGTSSGGHAEIGPINWYIDEFSGGIDLVLGGFDIPDWICWVPGIPCHVDIPPVLLIGYAYGDGWPIGSFGIPLLIDFRVCGSGFPGFLSSLVPYAGGLNGVNIDGNASKDFAIWIGTDPRMSLGGVLLRLLSIVGTTVADFLLDIIAGPIICGVFDIDDSKYQLGNTGTTDQDAYNPGNSATTYFDGNPVPGQPGQPAALPPELPAPTSPPLIAPLPISDPGLIIPPTPPSVGDPPLYTGPTTNLTTPVALCGLHVYDVLNVNTTVTVATTADATTGPLSGDNQTAGQKCPSGSEGKLELRANTMVVTGSITADGTSTSVPNFAPDYADYAATGSSGGTNAGVGFDGSKPRAGIRSYADFGNGTLVYPGGPGSSAGTGQTWPLVAAPFDSAGAGGNGGGAIVLKADAALQIDGTVTANGIAGSSNTGGACDADPDDNGTAGLQTHLNDNGTPSDNTDDFTEDNRAQDPPIGGYPAAPAGSKYEHTGFIGAGGGAGGGIALQARRTITVNGTVSAAGGNGGQGRLGAGGAGGGGIIKLNAPILSGPNVTQSYLNGNTVAGLNGDDLFAVCNGTPPLASIVPPEIAASADPTVHDVDDNPNVGGNQDDFAPFNGSVQETDGTGIIYSPPQAKLVPWGPFWWPGANPGEPTPTFDEYYLGGGGPNPVTMVTCAVRLPTTPSVGYTAAADANYLSSKMNQYLPFISFDSAVPPNPVNHGAVPSRSNPCGTPSNTPTTPISGATIVELNRTSFSGAVTTPTANAIDVGTSAYYGAYATAIRPQTAGNNCFDNLPSAAADNADCLVEPIGTGVDWVFGVDAGRPTANITLPLANQVFTTNAITLGIFGTDNPLPADPALSTFDYLECKFTDDPDWHRCSNGNVIAFAGADGPKTIQVRGYDKAGNQSATSSVSIYLDRGLPTSSAAFLSPPNGSAGWYKTAPAVRVYNYASGSPANATTPYFYNFDGGFEGNPICPRPGASGPPSAALDCYVPTSVTSLLATGDHDFNFGAINSASVRGVETPVHLKLDGEAPQVELATVPFNANQSYLGNDWYSVTPYLVVSAIDQFGASGLASQEISTDGGGTWAAYDPANPPLASPGVQTVCARATDVAGNTGLSPCKVVRVDADAPSLTLTPSIPVPGSGWYNVASGPPSFTASGFNDGSGVGAGTNPMRVRTDNAFSIDCAAPCVIPPTFTTGVHKVHASAADRFNNRSGETTINVKVDLEPPVVRPLLSPPFPDGQNGWYQVRPFLTLSTTDPGAGSGVATVLYDVNGGVPATPYTGPVQVTPGNHVLCWNATDVAGNTTPTACTALKVDTTSPTTTLTPSAPVPPSGWYTSPITVHIATNADADSTVNPLYDSSLADLCANLSPLPNPKQPSGTCVSLDHGPYVPLQLATPALAGDLALGEGIHVVRTFAVDVSGRRGPVTEGIYKIDLSAPFVAVRLLPPSPARNNWYRAKPLVVLRANDGEDGSGVTSLKYSIDTPVTAASPSYTGPFEIPESTLAGGSHTVYWEAKDIVGTRTGSKVVKVDVTPPTAKANNPQPIIWIRLLGGTVKLNYTVGDNLSSNVRVGIVLFDVTGNVVKRIDAGTVAVPPGGTASGFVVWNGYDNTLLNLVPLGVYYYRVAVIDEAGNTSYSGESKPITIRLL